MEDTVGGDEFAFEIRDVFLLGDGYQGDATLVGPPMSPVATLTVGDTLDVPTTDGTSRLVTCVEFPLINLGPDRLRWVRASVIGVSPHDVRIGGRAFRPSKLG